MIALVGVEKIMMKSNENAVTARIRFYNAKANE
jgi:hypothetical protein